jgi:RHS repeat-associated protein
MYVTALTQTTPQTPFHSRPRVSAGLLSLAVLALLSITPASAQDVVEVVITDALGNIRVITDDKGNVLERHDYLPFGEECTSGPCAANPGVGAGQPRKFTGKERDVETGLDYFGARYYNANTGRFTTVDPVLNTTAALVDPQRWNRYAYGRNNPLRYVDPDGKDIFTYFGGLVTAFGSNLSGGLIARPTSSDSDFRFGQTVGDTLSLAAAGYEAYVGGGLIVGGGGATLTVAGGTVGVPAAVGGGLLVGHAGAFGGSAIFNLSKNTEGIYEFPDATSAGRTYVGQSGDRARRLKAHEKSGRKGPGTEPTETDVAGGKTAREVAEQRRIDELGGTRDKPGSQTSNIRNPIGPARKALMEKE